MEQIMLLIQWEVLLIEGNIVDVGLSIFVIKDAGGKQFNIVAKEILFKINLNWCE